ncbi:MAG: primosomal protein N' [Nitrospirae bacterium]|nr:MAG: primosomal protein N' [Nitrospirota bacterium]
MRVRVPFGRSTLTGYIVAVTPHAGSDGKPARIREILTRVDEKPSIPPDLLALAEWVSEQYLAPLGQCLRLAFHGAPEKPRSTSRTKRADDIPSVAPVPASDPSTFSIQRSSFNEELAPLRAKVLDALAHHRQERIFVPAATDELGELYGHAIEATLEQGRTALVLFPEVARVEASQGVFLSRWGRCCQVYHGGLPPGARRKAWVRIQQGDASVVVGTRSAVFAPLAHLGLIVVDQEDHPAYKAENAPRYDARAVADERARRAGAVLVLASAHPSLDTVHAVGLEVLALRATAVGAPPVTVVDLRDAPLGTMLSPPLTEAIAACLAAGKKALLFLNRKGYAPVLLCHDCGQAVKCPACAVGWVYHKHNGLLRCGHCGRTGQVPEACPSCLGAHLLPSGFGTEAVEEALKVRFPEARVARLERDRSGGDRANSAILTLLQAGELNILIGTQLVITRSPRPVVSLVGLVHPDAALNLPDFRAAERAYHTLREVMALADFKDSTARIVMQTYVPHHHVIRALAERDPRFFYDNELAARKALGYPPFGQLIGLRVSGIKEERVETAAKRWAELLRSHIPSPSRGHGEQSHIPSPSMGEGEGGGDSTINVLGPIPAVPFRAHGRVRWQLVVKGTDGTALRQAVQSTLAELDKAGRAGGLRYDIDVDPQSLL